jgi:acetyl-CoA carboxylase biotin carboxyl carrier protein
MNSKKLYEHDEHDGEAYHDNTVSAGQLKHLIHLMDESDVTEVEVKRPQDGLRLVLRKVRAEQNQSTGEMRVQSPSLNGMSEAEHKTSASAVDTKQIVTAPLVGVFYTWVKPKGKPVVVVEDRVKVGQIVGTIQSLNVISEVESPFAGRIVEFLATDGQPVEYGQQLVVIDSSEEG